MEAGGGGRHGTRMPGKNGLVPLPIEISGDVALNVWWQRHCAELLKQFHRLAGRKRCG
ncbi:MAG: hypothetical protein CM1200mP2_53410 [Planctomycetaceae bacterium]|nr:MAG: hypothetical protein CM1200mP2_53410 [Planctomycetaceae bacterium]